jgi:predicted ribosome quality control (RQC) complex YloA/Tae2 family protein
MGLFLFYINNIYVMRLKKYLQFNEGKKKEFNFQRMEIDGFLVYRGRDAKSNDHLTFNVADNDDIWMHVKGVPGSHVVIIVRDNIPTPEVIKKVAEIAKDNSKAKGTGNAVVVYCKRRFVSKRPGMNDGQVMVDYKNAHEVTI